MDQILEAEAPYSPQWWQSRTNDELHELMRGGLAEGEAGLGAHRELERRAREQARAEEQKEMLVAQQKKSLRLRILEGVLLTALIVLLFMKLVR